MPKYNVRFYSEYCDEFQVEAATEDEARTLAEIYEYVCDLPNPGELEKLDGKVTQLGKHVYVGSSDTDISELDEDGNWLEG